jgi:hypothetical protein
MGTLATSLYTLRNGTEWKSCPGCSLIAGRHVWHPVMEFGTRNDGGVYRVQAYCGKCRTACKSKKA